LDPSISAAVEELAEMQRLVAVIDTTAQQQQELVRNSSDKEEAEVARCFFNLSTRAQVR
jgi:dihydropteroate synthase